jgi:hypothetical protein
MRGNLSRPAGEAVSGGTREWRLVSVSPEWFGEHTAESLIEKHALNSWTNMRDLRSGIRNQSGGLVET